MTLMVSFEMWEYALGSRFTSLSVGHRRRRTSFEAFFATSCLRISVSNALDITQFNAKVC
jgi:hypothetical protein